MCVHALSAVLNTEIKNPGAKLLMIALANECRASSMAEHPSGAPNCWPKIRTLCKETSMSKSTVKRQMGWLVEHEYLSVEQRQNDDGTFKANRYFLHLGGGFNMNLPGSTVEPRGGSTVEPTKEPKDRTYKNNNKKRLCEGEAELRTVLPDDVARALVDHRKKKKSALTAYAANLMAKKLALCPDPVMAANTIIERGWTGFDPEWIGILKPKESKSRKMTLEEKIEQYQRTGVWLPTWGNLPSDEVLRGTEQNELALDGETIQ